MVDAERLRRLLQRVSDDLAVLEAYASSSRTWVRDDPARLGHVKYLFITAIEGCIDAAHHVCASEGWGPPETNAEAFTVMARHRAIDAGLGQAMAGAVGFRNLLVHGYARVDDDRVVAFLDRVGDLSSFVSALAPLIG